MDNRDGATDHRTFSDLGRVVAKLAGHATKALYNEFSGGTNGSSSRLSSNPANAAERGKLRKGYDGTMNLIFTVLEFPFLPGVKIFAKTFGIGYDDQLQPYRSSGNSTPNRIIEYVQAYRFGDKKKLEA